MDFLCGVTEQKTFLGYQNWSAKRTETEVDKFFQVSSVDMADSLLEHAASRVDSSRCFQRGSIECI